MEKENELKCSRVVDQRIEKIVFDQHWPYM